MRAHLHTFVHAYIHGRLRIDAADEMMRCNRMALIIAFQNNSSMCDTITDIDAHSVSFNPFNLDVKLQENVFQSCIPLPACMCVNTVHRFNTKLS